MRLTRLLFVTCALCAALIACGGGGRGGSGVIPGSGGSQGSASRPVVTLKMVIPKTTQITSARTKKPEYVSAAVASIVYEITTQSGTTSLVSGNDYVNVTASPSPCTSGSNGLVCTISMLSTLSASGTYNVSIATYDSAQSANCVPGAQTTSACAGNLLGFATLPETITVGSAAPVAVTLGGIPAYLQGQALTGYVDGSGNNSTNNQLTIYGGTPQSGVAEFLDADGNVIIPPGAPTVTASSSNTSALTVAVATPTPGQYQITWTPVMSGPYVQPGSYTVTLSIAVPNTTIVESYPITIQLVHSGVFTAVCGGQNDQANVFGYLDGNTNGAAPDLTIATGLANCTQAPGLATDHTGNLYVADGSTLWEFPVAPGTNPAPIASAGAGSGLESPYTVALDRDGNVYVGDTSLDEVLAFGPAVGSSFGNPLATISSGNFNGYEPGGVGADNAGNLYIAVQEDGDLQIFQTQSLEGGLSGSSAVNPLATLSPSSYNSGTALAIDVQPSPSTPPNIWTAGVQTSPNSGALWDWSPLGALLNTYSAGGADAEGVAVDGNGVVYLAYLTGTGGGPFADFIAPLAPPSYAAGSAMAIPSPAPYVMPSGPSATSISVAVAPAAGVLGNRSGGGSPSPISTQSPAPSLRHP
jgi:hypothetical protein